MLPWLCIVTGLHEKDSKHKIRLSKKYSYWSKYKRCLKKGAFLELRVQLVSVSQMAEQLSKQERVI